MAFPGQTTPIKGLISVSLSLYLYMYKLRYIKGFFRCGDSTNPGIGVPAVAASGAMAANAIMSIQDHWRLLDRIRI